MNPLRRLLLRGTTLPALSALLGTGLLTPVRVLAADWNRSAFNATTLADALKAYGTPASPESREIVINAPEVAENGAQVPIEISVNLPKVQSIAVFADKNPLPLLASLELTPGVLPYWRLPVKLAETTRVRVVVKTESKTYSASREVKVTIGGCGN